MSVFGLWARRCRKWVLLILLGMAAAEAALFIWAMSRSLDGEPEQIFSDSHIELAGLAAFTALTYALSVAGADNGSRYTLRRLAMTERKAFFCRAAHNALCCFLFWSAQLAVALGLFLIWKRAYPALWGRQTLLLAFYRQPFLHGLLPFDAWYVYARNVLWCAVIGCITAGRRASRNFETWLFLMLGIYFPEKAGAGAGWSIFLSLIALTIVVPAVLRRTEPDEDEEGGEADGARA